jgi:hypothetical protein
VILWETHAHGQPARLVAINALQLQARIGPQVSAAARHRVWCHAGQGEPAISSVR